MSIPPYRVMTLCEICANACGGCSWSRYKVQSPVPGWTAIQREGDVSWTVLDCPEFALEERYRSCYERFLAERVEIPHKGKAEIRRLTDADMEKAMFLYQSGLSDTAIAKEIGISTTAISRWRRQKQLPNNYHLSGWNDRMMLLYGAGLTDEEIAHELGCKKSTVADWRWSHSLPTQSSWSNRTHLRRMRLLEQGLTDEQIAEKEGVFVETIQKWRMGVEYRKLCVAAAEKEPPTA